MKTIKENIIEILVILGVIFISTAAFLTNIRIGFLVLGILLMVMALLAFKGGGE